MDSSALASAESWLWFIAVAKLIAAFLVAAGVVVEFATEWIARPFERVVKEAHEIQVAELRKETTRLAAEAEHARSEIAKANTQAAEANRVAEGERLARVKIEERLAPRSLSEEQLRQFADAIRPFSPAKIIIVTGGGEETERFAGQVRDAIFASGNRPIDMIGRNLSGSLAPGISVDGRDPQLVKTVAELLRSLGHKVNDKSPNAATGLLTYPGSDSPEAKSASASIFVGEKPLPTITP